MYHGIMNIYKEAGYTSHDVIARLRGILGQKKIGHTGTLDPDAVGVLPVCLGVGTKLCDMFCDQSKEYVAELLLGVTTDTQDMSGTVLTKKEITATPEQVKDAACSFLGAYEQVPPMYSALKVNGRKLYELAREGKEIERKARTVQIKELEILKIELPIVRLRVVCSKGTYIRTLCDDIGKTLGCGGAMQSLQRTKVGDFRIEDALPLSKVEELRVEGRLDDLIVPVQEMFPAMRSACVRDHYRKLLENGNQLVAAMLELQNGLPEPVPEDGEQFRIFDEQGVFYGIYRYEQSGRILRPVKMFLI